MIKCEVVFDGDEMLVNGISIIYSDSGYHYILGVGEVFYSLESAVKYCMEKSNEN